MLRRRPQSLRLLAVVALLFPMAQLATAGPTSRGCADTLCAGAGRAEITPPVGTPLWGYGDRSGALNPADFVDQRTGATRYDTDFYAKAFRASQGIHQRLYARAFVLQDADGDRVAMVQLDLGSVSGPLHQEVADRLVRLGIDRTALLLAPTHTHAGPGALHQAPFHFVGFGDMYDPRTLGIVRDGIVAAVERAVVGMAPAKVAIGQTQIEGATRNRALAAHRLNPDADRAAAADDAVNKTLTMVRLDHTDGTPLGVFTTFANHGTVEDADNALLSGDNAGYAERILEAGMSRGTSATPLAAFANSAEGDVAPATVAGDPYAAAYEIGRRQAEPALRLWRQLKGQLSTKLDLSIGYDAAPMSEGASTGYDMSATPLYGAGGSCLPTSLPGVGAKCPMAPSGPPPSWMPFQAIRVNDTLLLALPWEVTTQSGVRIRAAAAKAGRVGRVAIVGLSNEYGGYLTTPQEYTAQGYEGQMTWWGPEQAEWVADMAARVAAAARDGHVLRPPNRDGAPGSDNASPLSQVAAAVRTPPGKVLLQPASSLKAGGRLVVRWTGGDPSVDAAHEQPFVTIERRTGASWRPVLHDGGGEIVLGFLRTKEANTWTASWRLPARQVPGTYRVHVTGTAYKGLTTVRYAALSASFAIH